MKKDKEFTVGLLVGGITDTFTISVCRGVIKTAKEMGIKLVIFPVKYLDRDLLKPNELKYEYQYNTLLSYATKDNLDAILVAADSIGFCTTKEKIQMILRQYKEIPCVLIASKLEGYVSVNYDNRSGIKEALEYLIHRLNCKKIGMIGGPDNNTDAYERKLVFLEILKENGIPFEERNYVEGRLSRYSEAAFDTFIEQNPDIEAVFCVNDDTAVGFYEALRKHNIKPGRQVMIFGYDNILLATKLKPALSSVLSDKAKLGEAALKTAVRMLKGEKVESLILPSQFIRRDSIRNEMPDNQNGHSLILNKEYIDVCFDNLFYCYENEGGSSYFVGIKKVYRKLMEKLICAYEETEQENLEDILNLLEEFLAQGALEYIDMERLVVYVEEIYRMFKRKYTGVWKRDVADIFTLTYQKIILAINQRYGEILESQNDKNIAMKLFTRDIMQFEKGNDQSYIVLLQHLNWLDIRNACIYVFEKPMLHLYQEEFVLPEKLYLKATLKDGETQVIYAANQETYIKDIFANANINDDCLPKVLFPLYSYETVYGVLLCDMADIFYENGDYFVNHIGSAVKMIDLLKTNDAIQHQLENNIAALKENNIVLDSLSKIDVLTGIYNRRGFYDAAEELLKKNKGCGYEIIVAYIDMNNLKIVNDRYGHDEGDFSIKKISEILTEVVGENGIVGRLGGDEFAFVMLRKDEGNIIEKIYARFQSYNETSPKDYTITVSGGTYIIQPDSQTTLKEALTYADEMLYEEKKHRVKKVAK
ncbi:MAG: GGDEF domain-containing protein [Lachnospiraceae bacterium]|nr:GGDEF domain-containing protein [Lachnospiraceae bacterium]